MSKWLDIYIVPYGAFITLLRMFQIGVVYVVASPIPIAEITERHLDISFSVWRFSTHLQIILSEENLCQDVIVARS
tara:strand:+ start:152 stop:379 length:228 start_codon:yes stop_codon:yes gene_type:complete